MPLSMFTNSENKINIQNFKRSSAQVVKFQFYETSQLGNFSAQFEQTSPPEHRSDF